MGKSYNVGKTMPFAQSPSHHHKYIGGMFTIPSIPSHGWFMALFYPHYE
jgi:hypothetical protein